VIDDEAKEAYLVSFILVFSASMGITFGYFDPSQFVENFTTAYTKTTSTQKTPPRNTGRGAFLVDGKTYLYPGCDLNAWPVASPERR
jgi:hypothetical protein